MPGAAVSLDRSGATGFGKMSYVLPLRTPPDSPIPMPPAPYSESLRRFARDLSTLREAQGVTVERIHQQSKIPLHVLQDFEADALLGNPIFNRVYLRSLVKTYADSLRLPTGEVLGALESAYAGEPKSLRYLGPRSLDAPVDAGPAPSAAAKPPPAAPPPGEPEGSTGTDAAPVDAAADASAGPPEAPAADEGVPVIDAGTVLSAAPPATAAPPAAVSPIAWPAVPVQRSEPMTPAGRAFAGSYSAAVEPRRVPSWLPAVLGVVALLVVIGGLLWWLGRDPDAAARTADRPAAAAPADTAAATRPAPAAPPVPVALPDTLVLTVRATTEPLRGLRIRRDGDARRPHWIEAGSEQTFAFRDSAFVYAASSPTAAYLLNGAPLDPASVRAADGTLVLVRDRLARR